MGRSSVRIVAAALCFFCGFAASQAATEDFAASFTLPTDPTQIIPGLSLNANRLSVQIEDGLAYLYLPGTFQNPDLKLLVYATVVPLAGVQRSFIVRVPVTSPQFVVTFKTIDPHGFIQDEPVQVIVSNWQMVDKKLKAVSKKQTKPRLHLDAELGLSFISYQETQFSPFSETAWTPKVSADFPIARYWDGGVSTSFTALPMSTNIAGDSLRFFGLNAQVGYRIPSIASPWSLKILFGGYYETTFSSGAAFGFSNVLGPELSPVLELRISNRNRISLYGKYSAILSNGVSFSSYDLATGLTYKHLLNNGHDLLASFDYAKENLNISSNFVVQMHSTTLSLGYSF